MNPLSLRFLQAANQGLMIEPNLAHHFLNENAAHFNLVQNFDLLERLKSKPVAGYRQVGRVGVVNLHGVTGYGLGPIEKHLMGMVDLQDFQANLLAAYQAPEVEKILIHAESPGGWTTGVEETAQMVKASPKPIETFGTGIHSAALWISGVANRVWGMPSGQYGSIGAVTVLQDISKAAEMQGVKVHIISSGWAKGQGIPGGELTPEYLAFVRDGIMENAQAFKNDLRSVRSTIPDAAMEGQSFSGRKAAELGIITGLASGVDQVIAGMNATT